MSGNPFLSNTHKPSPSFGGGGTFQLGSFKATFDNKGKQAVNSQSIVDQKKNISTLSSNEGIKQSSNIFGMPNNQASSSLFANSFGLSSQAKQQSPSNNNKPQNKLNIFGNSSKIDNKQIPNTQIPWQFGQKQTIKKEELFSNPAQKSQSDNFSTLKNGASSMPLNQSQNLNETTKRIVESSKPADKPNQPGNSYKKTINYKKQIEDDLLNYVQIIYAIQKRAQRQEQLKILQQQIKQSLYFQTKPIENRINLSHEKNAQKIQRKTDINLLPKKQKIENKIKQQIKQLQRQNLAKQNRYKLLRQTCQKNMQKFEQNRQKYKNSTANIQKILKDSDVKYRQYLINVLKCKIQDNNSEDNNSNIIHSTLLQKYQQKLLQIVPPSHFANYYVQIQQLEQNKKSLQFQNQTIVQQLTNKQQSINNAIKQLNKLRSQYQHYQLEQYSKYETQQLMQLIQQRKMFENQYRSLKAEYKSSKNRGRDSSELRVSSGMLRFSLIRD